MRRRRRSRCWPPPRCATPATAPSSWPRCRSGCRARPSASCPARRRRRCRPPACCAASPKRTACWPISAAARSSWCGSTRPGVRHAATLRLGVIRLAERAERRPRPGPRHRRGRPRRAALAARRRRPRPLSGRRRLARAGARAHACDRLPARASCTTTRSATRRRATLTAMIAGTRSAARTGCRGAPRRRERRPALRRDRAAPAAARDRRAPGRVQRQRHPRGLVHAAGRARRAPAGPAAGRRARRWPTG